jgi:hypothetical protein
VSDKVIDGSLPLAKRSHETYAWERSIATTPSIAAKRAGLSPRSGACSKLDRNPAVQARIAHLAKAEEEVIAAKRRRIEERLNLTAYANAFDFVKINPETKQPEPIDIAELVENESLGQLVTEWIWDHDTGELKGFRFSRGDSLAAIAQLRDMYGFKSPTKIAPTNPEGDGPAIIETITRIIVEPQHSDRESLPAAS